MEPVDPFSFRDGVLLCVVDSGVYRLSALQKAAYKLAGATTIHIAEHAAGKLALTFAFNEPKGEAAARAIGLRFLEEALDQESCHGRRVFRNEAGGIFPGDRAPLHESCSDASFRGKAVLLDRSEAMFTALCVICQGE